MSNDAGGGPNTIKVCIRVRPFATREQGEECAVAMPDLDVVTLNEPYIEKPRSFTFDRCFWSHNSSDSHFVTQETLMKELGEPLLDNALDGFNNCLFAYGQTGSGKTHSMLGGDGDQRGLLPRVLEELFRIIEKAGPKVRFTTKVSYLEIYNENLRDLLVPPGKQTKKLEVVHNPKLGTCVPGLSEVNVHQYKEVHTTLEFGQKTRMVAATSMNATSSRSHCIFTFNVEKEWGEGTSKQMVRAQVNLVDLAGSERQAKTQAVGERLKEGAMINQSLSVLAAVISKLAELAGKPNGGKKLKPGEGFVPFRNSKLTHLLQESLSGNSKTIMIAAISPAQSNIDESLSTLRFAQTCKKIQTKVVKNQDSREKMVADMKAEIEALKAQLAAGGSPGRGSSFGFQGSEEVEAMKQKLEEDQAVLVEMEQNRAMALEDMALTLTEIAQEMGVDPNTPQLINISHDPALNGCLVYYLQKSEEVQIGSSTECKITLSGLGIQPYMCSLTNSEDKDVVLELLSAAGVPLDEADLKDSRRPRSLKSPNQPGRVLLNGRMPPGPLVPMHNCDRLIIGHAYCFRLTLPLEAAQANEGDLVASSKTEHNMEEALYEVVHEHADEFAECQALMESLKDRIGKQSAQDFLKLFGQTLPHVEEANLCTEEVRPQDLLRFQLEVTTDIMRFTSDEPELIVRLFQGRAGSEAEDVLGVFELSEFHERLERIREVHHSFHHRQTLSFHQRGRDPWMPYSYTAVQEMMMQLRNDLDEERHRRESAESEARQLRKKLAVPEATTRTALAEAVDEGSPDPLNFELGKANEDAKAASSLAARLLDNLKKLQLEIRDPSKGAAAVAPSASPIAAPGADVDVAVASPGKT